MRDDFAEKEKQILAKRVGMLCSNPNCRKLTAGPRDDPTKALNIGVAAHVTAASPQGPRYDVLLSDTERCSIENGIWLCQNCGKLVDNDEGRYTVELLRNWKRQAEEMALQGVESNSVPLHFSGAKPSKECDLVPILTNFRTDRCAAILSGGTPLPLAFTSRLVVHLLPFDMLTKPRRFEVRDVYARCQNLCPPDGSGYNRKVDAEGCFSYSKTQDGIVDSYAYIFRNGAVEAVGTASFASSHGPGEKGISSGFESPVIGAIEGYLDLLVSLEVAPPYALFLSLLNVRGCVMQTVYPSLDTGHPVARDHIYLDEVVFDSAPSSVASALFDVFNGVWNACGYEQSDNYDRNGVRKPNAP